MAKARFVLIIGRFWVGELGRDESMIRSLLMFQISKRKLRFSRMLHISETYEVNAIL